MRSIPLQNYAKGVNIFFTRSDMTSHVVYDPEQKKGDDSYHTIVNAVGTSSFASPRDTGLLSTAGI